MFIGHYAPALLAAANRRGPRLARLVLAAQFVDVVLFALVLAGVERMRETPGFTAMNGGDFYYMPYTHSAVGTLGFAALWAVATRLAGGTWRAAWIGAAVVAAHWPLDLLVHAPDLTIAGVGPRYGLGLWNQPLVAMPLELALVAVALTFYASETRPRGPAGRASLAAFGALLLLLQFAHWFAPRAATVVDPVPTHVPLLALAAFALIALAAWWVDATRERAA